MKTRDSLRVHAIHEKMKNISAIRTITNQSLVWKKTKSLPFIQQTGSKLTQSLEVPDSESLGKFSTMMDLPAGTAAWRSSVEIFIQ